MTETVSMSELSKDDYKRRVVDQSGIVLLPVGAVEQHGYSLPLGTDWLLADFMAREVAREVNGVVAPPIMYAGRSQVRAGGGAEQYGTTSLDGQTLIAMVKEVLLGLAGHGVKKIALIDAHFENRSFLDEACYQCIRELKYAGIEGIKIFKTQFAEGLSDEVRAKAYEGLPFPGRHLEHGGFYETALMLYAYPHLVDQDKIPEEDLPDFPPYDVFPENLDWVPESGNLSSGKLATAARGKLMFDEMKQVLVASLRAEFD
ncbi:MAG: creatininase [Pseudomonadota bacterium]